MTAPAGTGPPHGAYLRGLDGLRAVAVLGVLGYHSGWGWLGGGFLGVSLFFTLSGFLITRLLLVERQATGGVDLRRFWARRARRLLPAAFAGILLAIGVAAAVGTASQRLDLPGDVAAALLYVANWRFVLDGASYAGLYEAPSPLQHLWSLAVEEQLYLVVPLVLVGLLAAGRRIAGAAVTVLVVAIGVGTATLGAGAARETLYYGSHVRAGELLVGVALALFIAAPDRPAPRAVRAVAGPLALAGVAGTWVTWRVTDAGLFQGGLVLHAVLVAVVLWAVTGGPSPLTDVLERRPLVWLGRRSYGVYLYHWPLFLLAEQVDSTLPRPVLLGAAWAASLLLAGVSYVVLEQPIRTGQRLRRRPHLAAGLVGAPSAILVFALAISGGPGPVHDPDAASARLDELARASTPAPTTSPDPAAPPALAAPREDLPPRAERAATPPTPALTAERPVRLAIFGDSIAAANTLGLAEWAVEHPSLDLVPGRTIPGCTLVAEGTRWSGESPLQISDGCDWMRHWPDVIAVHRPHVAIIAIGALDALPWSLPGADGRLRPGDARVDDRIRTEVARINDFMADAGVEVVWLTLPDPMRDNGTGTLAGLARVNQLIGEAAADRDHVRVVDMAGMVNRWNDEGLYRSDGMHLDPHDARRLAEELLAPAVLDLVALD